MTFWETDLIAFLQRVLWKDWFHSQVCTLSMKLMLAGSSRLLYLKEIKALDHELWLTHCYISGFVQFKQMMYEWVSFKFLLALSFVTFEQNQVRLQVFKLSSSVADSSFIFSLQTWKWYQSFLFFCKEINEQICQNAKLFL